MYTRKQPNNGNYAITEQGDLGLGLTPINEEVEEKDNDEDCNDREPDR